MLVTSTALPAVKTSASRAGLLADPQLSLLEGNIVGVQRCASPMTPDVYFGAVVKGPDTLMVPSGIGPHAQPRAVNALPHIVSVCPINGLLDDERIMFHSFVPILLCRLAERERLDAA